MSVMRVAWVALVAGCGFQTPGRGGTDAAVDADVAIDAREIDAAIDGGFDFSTCPASYNLNLGLPGPTRYRLITAGRAAWVHSDDCNNDLQGATHLIVLEDMNQVIALGNFVNNATGIEGNDVWIGGVQERGSATPGANWLGFDGAPLIGAWATNEPNDDRGEDNEEQFVKVERNRSFFVDIRGDEDNGAVCECDGKPVAKNAADAITASR
jgi:hypothetical protein